MRLILASQSPRRSLLLRAAGFEFDIVEPTGVDETRRKRECPIVYVTRAAHAKALRVAKDYPDCCVIGADTIVIVNEEILGKPGSNDDATRMLRLLSGQTHKVLTGMAVHVSGRQMSEVRETRVTFSRLTETEIKWYVRSGEPRDKAGGYAIQGLASRFVSGIEGSYSNVVGLPIETLHRLLAHIGSEQLPRSLFNATT